MFWRWRCLKHGCRSYNFNLLNKHEFDNCDIVKDMTVGIVKPKTTGGVNGDISRNNYPDWIELCKFKENQKRLSDKWNTFIENRRIEISKFKKNANRSRRLSKN
jgi:hypothetical protein